MSSSITAARRFLRAPFYQHSLPFGRENRRFRTRLLVVEEGAGPEVRRRDGLRDTSPTEADAPEDRSRHRPRPFVPQGRREARKTPEGFRHGCLLGASQETGRQAPSGDGEGLRCRRQRRRQDVREVLRGDGGNPRRVVADEETRERLSPDKRRGPFRPRKAAGPDIRTPSLQQGEGLQVRERDPLQCPEFHPSVGTGGFRLHLRQGIR